MDSGHGGDGQGCGSSTPREAAPQLALARATGTPAAASAGGGVDAGGSDPSVTGADIALSQAADAVGPSACRGIGVEECGKSHTINGRCLCCTFALFGLLV